MSRSTELLNAVQVLDPDQLPLPLPSHLPLAHSDKYASAPPPRHFCVGVHVPGGPVLRLDVFLHPRSSDVLSHRLRPLEPMH
ncbi:hypothetical protein [Lysobacter sp. HA18]